jgi:hypothetical protein
VAEADWAVLNDGLDIATVDRGVTTGITPPNGGGSFVHGFASLANTPGASGLYATQADFNPLAKGGSMRGALQRGPGGGATLFAPLLFLCAGGNSVNDTCYKLGLSDEDPHRILLRKGSIVTGIAGVSTSTGLLMQSSSTYVQGTWVHMRLDVIVNLSGDVILLAYINDLDSNPVTAPVWVEVPGMEGGFVDDALGVASGSPPLTSGRAGFAFQTAEVTRRGWFDHLELLRQT